MIFFNGRPPFQKNMKKPRNNAFTLIEILAAAIILTAALAVISASIGNSFSHFRATRLSQAARRIAMEKLELAAADVQTYPAGGTETELATNFDWQLRLITPGTSTAGVVTRLACDVSWSFRNKTQSLTLQRVILPPDAQTTETTQK